MRSYWLAAAVIAGFAGATPAVAQQRVWQDGRWVVMPKHRAPTMMRTNPYRWTMRDGRWDAGYRAPGGWNAYRRLHRGGRLPGFWMGADYRVDDYLSFGLAAPPPGYSWVRYYDDAVLVDREGSVWDSVDGIGWGGAVAVASADTGYARADSRAGAGYPTPRIEPVDPDDHYDRDDERYDAPPPPPYDAPPPPRHFDAPGRYRGPYPGGYSPPVAPPPMVPVAPPACPQFCGGAWQPGYSGMTWQNGAWVGNYGAGTTVVVIPGAVTTTTTTTEYVERVVATKTYRRPVKRVWRKVRPRCGC